ncbi:MAG: glycosyltransferase [Alphaproteobacteria bacterium PRO2]|nr:glycosyltransferase [Alphaproteobacteria bacterium PRO2]
MKILQIMAGAGRGGAETAFVDITTALHEAGETIEIVTRANDIRVPALRAAGITVHTLPFGGRVDVFTRWRLASIIRKFRPDIVQSWMARAAWKTPSWDRSMNIPRYSHVARLGGYYKLKYFASADHFVANTPDIRRYLVENGIAQDAVTHINNFAPEEISHNPLRRSDFGTPQDAPLLAALGRLHPNKAFDTLIRSMAELPGVYLWIAGEGPERGALEKLIAELNLGERVKLLGWRSDRADLLAAADICVIPSRREPFGNVFIQAWAQKIPLITTASEGPSQYVRDGLDALVTPVDDAGALAKAVSRLVADKALQKQLIEDGYKRYLAEFTKENTVRAYLGLYHALAGRPTEI